MRREFDLGSDTVTHPDTAVVTGAFSYTGRYIARRLLDAGVRVRTLTGHPDREDPFDGRVEVSPLDFSDGDGLRRSMQGADVLYNTYWVRFARGETTFERAVANSKTLFEAAGEAGVGRIVHVSITNASSGSRLPYFSGKGRVEEMLKGLGVPYAIVRPTLVFGAEDVLLNNMAWAIRRFPVFPIAGSGKYLVRPVYVDDLAALAVAAGSQTGDTVADAVGPETYTFEELLRLLADAVGSRCRFIHTSPAVSLALTGLIGTLIRDVVLTRDEIDGLMARLLTSNGPATCMTSLSGWLDENADALGHRYVSELRRNFRR